MKKRKDESPAKDIAKKTKSSQEDQVNLNNILQFCTSLNYKFGLIQKEEIKEGNFKNFIEALKTTPIKKGKSGNDLYIMHYLAGRKNEVEKNIQLAEYFIKNGGDINQKTKGGHTSLVFSAIKENQPFFKFLIENKANINTQNVNGNSIIHNIIKQEKGLDKFIKLLIHAGANIELVNNSKQTPSEYAFIQYDIHSLLCLIDHGAKITNHMKDDIFGKDPLHHSHELCQNLSFLAIYAWSLLSSEKIPTVTIEGNKNDKYFKLAKENSNLIKHIANNIIVTSPPELALERLKNFQNKMHTLGITSSIPTSELFFAKQEIALIGEFVDSCDEFSFD